MFNQDWTWYVSCMTNTATARQTDTSETSGAANLKCKNKACKRAGRQEFVLTTTVWAYDGRPASSTVATINGRQFSIRDPYALARALYAPCPACGSQAVTVNVVKGRLLEDKECGARCRNATGADCECSCVGANHGAAHANW